ncbi:unnamed protein product [Linum trigynum]|uniref:Uncharacterized protein n=1 Tax=Linum trigynum TaxID=586398 RepID=A0AAV2D9V8_9ROSI
MGASSRVAGAIWSDLLEAEAEKKEEAGFVAAGETVVAAAVVVLLAGGESLDRRQPLRHGDRSVHSKRDLPSPSRTPKRPSTEIGRGRHCFAPLTTKASDPLPINSATAGRQRLPPLKTKS